MLGHGDDRGPVDAAASEEVDGAHTVFVFKAVHALRERPRTIVRNGYHSTAYFDRDFSLPRVGIERFHIGRHERHRPARGLSDRETPIDVLYRNDIVARRKA